MPPSDPLLPLRTLTTLLTTTPETQLPAHTPLITTTLYSTPLLTTAFHPPHKRYADESSALLHKLKTRVSALLQSRSAPARFAALVVVKCTFESSYDALTQWGPTWIKLSLPLLSRPEPAAVLSMLLRILARTFTALTRADPALTRELVTPNLPSTIPALLTLAESTTDDPALLADTLETLRDILEAHPVTFRPFATRTRALVLTLLQHPADDTTEALARDLFVALHRCASNTRKRPAHAEKTGPVAAEWRDSFLCVVAETHRGLDEAFAAVVEEGGARRAPQTQPLGLNPEVAMRVLATFLDTETTAQTTVPVGEVVVLARRVLGVGAATPANPAVEAHARAMLLLRLGALQVAALRLLGAVLERFGTAVLGFAGEMVDALSGLEAPSPAVRRALYPLLAALLALAGAGLDKAAVEALAPLVAAACEDLLPPVQKKTDTAPLLKSEPEKAPELPRCPEAEDLLVAALHYLPAEISSAVRVRLEKTAVVTGNRKALLAATLWPRGDGRGSLVPHLVGAGSCLLTEAVVRPRLPVVWTGRSWKEEKEAREEEEEDEEESESEAEVQHHSTGRLGLGGAEIRERTPEKKVPRAAAAVESSFWAPPPQVTQSTEMVDASQDAKRRKVSPAPVAAPAAGSGAATSAGVVSEEKEEKEEEKEEKEKNVWKSAMELDTTQTDDEEELEIPEIMMGGDSSDEEE